MTFLRNAPTNHFSLDKNEDTFLRIAIVILRLQKFCANVLEKLITMGPHPEEWAGKQINQALVHIVWVLDQVFLEVILLFS